MKKALNDIKSEIVQPLFDKSFGENDPILLALQDINRIENLYEKQGKFKVLTIYYNTPSKSQSLILKC